MGEGQYNNEEVGSVINLLRIVTYYRGVCEEKMSLYEGKKIVEKLLRLRDQAPP